MEKANPVGCYFLLANEPSVGSPVEMEIHIPAELIGQPMGTLICQGKVVEVEKNGGEGRTGVTCTIEHYQLVPEAADCKVAEENT